MVKRVLGTVLATTGLVVGMVVGTGGTASAATCPSSAHPKTTGGEASWALSCSNGHLTVHGWVEDTFRDSRCAYVTITPRRERSTTIEACGSGVRKNFSEVFVDEYEATVKLRVA
ncbi:hypothetical protein ACIO02_22765 [Streptomyces sp. NPDC087568]|uniref:hypothetical protein n=1 Tax=Streptomyces sp. NPDC087568 TaxID=3365799 RepID=UPI0037FE578B